MQTVAAFLLPHPTTVTSPDLRIAASAEPTVGGGLRFRYVLRGELATLLLPAAGPAIRSDGLWQHTCCEAFVTTPAAQAYREFNFSPASAWAAYAFADYRHADPLPAGPVPVICCKQEAGALTLTADIDRSWLPEGEVLCVGLSAVIEAVGGERTYWALRHPCPQPDFHHRDGFTLRLSRHP